MQHGHLWSWRLQVPRLQCRQDLTAAPPPVHTPLTNRRSPRWVCSGSLHHTVLKSQQTSGLFSISGQDKLDNLSHLCLGLNLSYF